MRHKVAVLAVCLLLLPALPVSAAEAVDFTTWVSFNQPHAGIGAPGNGSWQVTPAGDEVHQTVNGLPTFFASPEGADGNRITATFTTPAFDDDFFGIALGFDTNPADPATDYLLVDWRKGTQSIDWGEGTGPVTGTAGLAVSRVSGVPTLNEIWGHVDSAVNPVGSVVELARGAIHGNVGWVDNSSYDFVVEYTTTSLKVWVNGGLEIDLAGDFPVGPMALYNFSQPDMSMSAVTTEPLNSPPEVVGSGAADVVGNEGSVGSTSGAFTDADDDSLTLSCEGDCSGFVPSSDGSWTWDAPLVEGPAFYSVSVTASDGVEETVDTFDVTILNLAPVITGFSNVPDNHDIGSTLDVEVAFTDAGLEDTHTATFDWGDGSSSDGLVVEVPGSGEATASHIYATPGTYVVSVTVYDDDGGYDTAILGEVFVFDPDTFVTGGGWVRPDESGKATFGFVARYNRNADVMGSLQVQVHPGLNVHATSLTDLLIVDGVASFSGTAKVNGESGYTFEVVARDERYASTSADLFWISVTGPGGVIYNDGLYPSEGLAVTGKGIQVHR